jgi:polysaccharide biosynthesis protein VpsM
MSMAIKTYRRSSLSLLVASAAALDMGSTHAAETVDTIALTPSSAVVANPSFIQKISAYESSGIPVGSKRAAMPIKFDGVNVYLSSAFSSGYDSNVTQATTGLERSSAFYKIRPSIIADLPYRSDRYTLGYVGDYTGYGSVAENNTYNSDFVFNAQNEFTTRSAFAWGVSYLDRYDPIGSTDRSIGSSVPDHHHDWLVNGTFRYGALGAPGQLEFDAGLGGKRYQNNRESTASADVNLANFGARFYYRVAPKTRLLAELRNTTFDYVDNSSLLDNSERRYLIGGAWDATAATSGVVKFGALMKDFKANSRRDYVGFTWEASLRWKPLTYTNIDFLSGRAAVDPSGSSTSFVIERNNTLKWTHDWTSYLHSTASAGIQQLRYQGTERNDKVRSLSAGLSYDVRRWLSVGVEYSLFDRDSSIDTDKYIRRLMALKMDASL